MPCNLVILGKKLNIDSLIDEGKLDGFSKIYKGQPKYDSKPNGLKVEYSAIAIQTSKAGFDDLDQQIIDTLRYLKRNKAKLTRVRKFKNIDIAFLDFGIKLRIDNDKTHLQVDKFPNELLRVAGDIGLDIEISIYSMTKSGKTKIRTNNAKPKSA